MIDWLEISYLGAVGCIVSPARHVQCDFDRGWRVHVTVVCTDTTQEQVTTAAVGLGELVYKFDIDIPPCKTHTATVRQISQGGV